MSIEDDNPVSLERRDLAILDVLLETLPDLIYFKDLVGRYVRISRSHASILGLREPSEAIGRTVEEFVSPEHAKVAMCEEREVVRTGVPIEGKEELVTLIDGRELWFSTTKRPWLDADGQVIGTIGVIRNIDAEKRAHERLAAEHTLLRTIIDHLPSRIFVKDSEGRFVINNRVHLKSLGVTRQDEATGKRTIDFFPSDRGMQALQDDMQVLSGGPPIFDQEKSDFGEEGRARWSLTTKVPLKSLSGGIVGLVGISHDITQRRRYEQELRRRNLEMETDLRMACQMQHAFMPQSYPVVPRSVDPDKSLLQFSHRYLPAATLGGDFFDVNRISEYEAGVLLCDVMGHGVRAGLITALIRGLVAELSAKASAPALMLAEINKGLVPFLSQAGLPVFATVFYGVIDVKAGTFRFTNAGHPAPYVLRRADAMVEPLLAESPEPAAGLETDFLYTQREVAFDPGDALFMFSDGLFEASNAKGEELGEHTLRTVVQDNMALRDGELLDTVLKRVTDHAGEAKIEDDICMLLVERKG
jgi:sigma-B regulation protein RsbU (phosphoserine phosphatase)